MGNSQEPQDFNISVMPSRLTPVHVAKAAEGLNLYDTASHQVSHFVPLKPGEVGIYVCGATVQSSPHIGHIRAAVAFDIVRRWFLKLGYKVTFVRNVTDIDDKILDKAAAPASVGGPAPITTSANSPRRTTRSACCRPPWNLAPPATCRT